MDENPYESPSVEHSALDHPNGTFTDRGRPPLSVIVVWCSGFILIPLSLITSFALGLFSVFYMLPLAFLVAMLLVRKPWIWGTAMLFFPVYSAITFVVGQYYASSKFPIIAYLFLPAAALGGIISICLITRSARDYYYRTKA